MFHSRRRPSIAYLIDPRFPGGTSAALASEIPVASKLAHVSVHASGHSIFGDRAPNARLLKVLAELGLEIQWDRPTVSADVVVVQNPVFLKRRSELGCRIIARHLVVVAHENFLRPGDKESFDVSHCLEVLENSSVSLAKSVAPVSDHNRQTVHRWLDLNPRRRNWGVLDENWFNVLDFELRVPSANPSDRRGRLSRPGLEKFPGIEALERCFPRHAERNVMLGADPLIAMDLARPHWTLLPFGSVEVDAFFEMIDFLVYFTAPTLRESFGRVLAEGIAAGKLVLADPANAANFGDAITGCEPHEVDDIIAKYVSNPDLYVAQVTKAQDTLAVRGPERFGQMLSRQIDLLGAAA